MRDLTPFTHGPERRGFEAGPAQESGKSNGESEPFFMKGQARITAVNVILRGLTPFISADLRFSLHLSDIWSQSCSVGQAIGTSPPIILLLTMTRLDRASCIDAGEICLLLNSLPFV